MIERNRFVEKTPWILWSIIHLLSPTAQELEGFFVSKLNAKFKMQLKIKWVEINEPTLLSLHIHVPLQTSPWSRGHIQVRVTSITDKTSSSCAYTVWSNGNRRPFLLGNKPVQLRRANDVRLRISIELLHESVWKVSTWRYRKCLVKLGSHIQFMSARSSHWHDLCALVSSDACMSAPPVCATRTMAREPCRRHKMRINEGAHNRFQRAEMARMCAPL
jgi:hypothetical protein